MTARHQDGTWTNWAGDQRCAPALVARPRSVDELAAAVRDAGAAERTVRVAGAGHSFGDLVPTDTNRSPSRHGSAPSTAPQRISTPRAALRRLAADARLAARVTLMVDSPDQLDLVDAVAGTTAPTCGCASTSTRPSGCSAAACTSARDARLRTARSRSAGSPAWCAAVAGSGWSG